MRCLEIRFDDQLFPWPDLPLFGTDAQHHWVTTHGPVRAIAYSNPAVDEFFNCEERSDENAWECKDTDYRKTVAFVRKIRDGFEIERAVLHVDHAVVETGGFDDVRHAARRELFQAGTERGSPLTHCPADAVVFHASSPI